MRTENQNQTLGGPNAREFKWQTIPCDKHVSRTSLHVSSKRRFLDSGVEPQEADMADFVTSITNVSEKKI